jgi:TfoX/Sxy family transcriptional regulator of competence genes
MDKFEKADNNVKSIFDRLIKDIDCSIKKMFGYPAAFIKGNMFTGAFANRIFFRVRKEDQDSWKRKYSALRDFEPVKGRTMNEYLEIDGKEENFDIMSEIIVASQKYMESLPEKIGKKRKK